MRKPNMILPENKIPRKYQQLHLGIQTLRAWLCLMVVYNHVPMESTVAMAPWLRNAFGLLCSMAVPSFVLISFYLSGSLFLQSKSMIAEQLRKKIKRLLLPFIAWSILGFAVYVKKISLANIFFQLLFGSVVNSPLYYLAITFYFILLFSMLTWLNFRLRLIALCVLMIVCFYIQYTGLNYCIFSDFSESSRYTLGRLGELFPYAVVGILLRHYFNISQCYDLNYRVNWWWFLIIVPVFIAGIILLRYTPKGFGYQGIGLAICSSSMFLMFLIQSNANLLNFTPHIVLSISNISLGIFCSHYLLNRIIRSWFGSLKIYDIIASIPFAYGLVLFICSVLLCLKLKNSFNGRLKPLVS